MAVERDEIGEIISVKDLPAKQAPGSGPVLQEPELTLPYLPLKSIQYQ